MSLTPGTQLGSYEIVGLLGAGGMGEVYRAKDTRLGRDVAVKTLPESVTRDPERLARFRREAQVLAALNHQHIASIYGLEEADSHRFLVLELVDGETLAARIQRGPLAIEEALPIAREIAEAIESAHERGIVHRDLKPANIALTSADRVKVLDFGLAKAADGSGTADSVSALNLPTITSPAMLTQVGTILGTAAYMSPEQTRGRIADKRSDVWAFGCVLFEMLTGKRAFDGEEVSDTLAAVLKSDPPWSELPPSVPPPIRTLLKGCLEKNHRERISDMSTVLFVLKQNASRELAVSPHAPGSALKRAWPVAAAVAGSLAVGAAAAIVFWPRASVSGGQVVRFSLPMTDEAHQLTTQRRAVAVSPDGSHIAYSAGGRIYVRPVAESESRPVAGTESGLIPTFSPDGQSIAFWADGALKRVSLSGGMPVTICATRSPFSLDWNAAGIVFDQRDVGIVRVSPDPGTPEPIVRLTDTDIISGVQLLPDGDTVLFSLGHFDPSDSNIWSGNVFIQSIRTGERTRILQGGTFPRYLPTGDLVYMVEGTLMRVPFDAARRHVTVGAAPAVEGVNRGGSAHFAVSDTGVLVYVPGPARGGQNDVFLYDRKGAITPLPLSRASYSNPRVSPDGKQLALETYDGKQSIISIYDLSGATALRRLTFGGNNRVPVWSRDGKRVAFQSDREGDAGIYWQPVDGGAPERLTQAEPRTVHTPESWSPIEDVLLYSITKAEPTETTLWTLSVKDRKTSRFSDVVSAGVPTNAVFSPDGHSIAYQLGDITSYGEPTVFVQPFPPTGTKHEIVRGGRPLWSPDGRELFFVPSPTQFMAVAVQTRPVFASTNPILVPRRFGMAAPRNPRPFDILPDGRFVAVGVANQTGEAEAPRIDVVVNWFEELKRKQPATK